MIHARIQRTIAHRSAANLNGVCFIRCSHIQNAIWENFVKLGIAYARAREICALSLSFPVFLYICFYFTLIAETMNDLKLSRWENEKNSSSSSNTRRIMRATQQLIVLCTGSVSRGNSIYYSPKHKSVGERDSAFQVFHDACLVSIRKRSG